MAPQNEFFNNIRHKETFALIFPQAKPLIERDR
jgi:hypothetical protein